MMMMMMAVGDLWREGVGNLLMTVFAWQIAIISMSIHVRHRHRLDFEALNDSISDLAEDCDFPKSLEIRVREYVLSSVRTSRINRGMDLYCQFSPGHQMEVCQTSSLDCIRAHPAFRDLRRPTMAQLAGCLDAHTYPEGEVVMSEGPCSCMAFLLEGYITVGPATVGPGTVVGVEAVMDSGSLKHSVYAATTIDIMLLTKPDIEAVLAINPHERKKVRRWSMKRSFARDAVAALRAVRPEAFSTKPAQVRLWHHKAVDETSTTRSILQNLAHLQQQILYKDEVIQRQLEQHAALYMSAAGRLQQLKQKLRQEGLQNQWKEASDVLAQHALPCPTQDQKEHNDCRDEMPCFEVTLFQQMQNIIMQHNQIVHDGTNRLQDSEDELLHYRFNDEASIVSQPALVQRPYHGKLKTRSSMNTTQERSKLTVQQNPLMLQNPPQDHNQQLIGDASIGISQMHIQPDDTKAPRRLAPVVSE